MLMGPAFLARARAIFCCLPVCVVLAGFSSHNAIAADDCHASPAPNIQWQDCDKSNLMLEGSDLGGANLVGADFSSTDLKNTNLTGANLEKVVLVRANVSGSSAKGALFMRVEAYRTNFSGIDAPGANFQNAELQRSNFHAAKLADSDFTKADLGRSQFDGADVSGSRFSLTNLARADFRGAAFAKPVDFDRAFFFLTRIEGVDLSAATALTQWQLDMACGDERTMLPAGLTRPKTWPCQFQQD